MVVMFIFVGFGNGLIDSAWCAWLGNMADANQIAGVLHACYAIGATVAPLIATLLFTKGGQQWYSYYYLLVSGIVRRVEMHVDFLDWDRWSGTLVLRLHVPESNRRSLSTRKSQHAYPDFWTDT
jgi:MFS family permease